MFSSDRVKKVTIMSQKKARTLLSYQSEGVRLQLIQNVIYTDRNDNGFIIVYQVMKNRRVLDSSHSEYAMRRAFAQYVQNNVLQLKIY